VSLKECPGCGWKYEMSEAQEHRAASHGHGEFDHGVLAELIARRWRQDRPYFTLRERTPGAWLEASWRRPLGKLHHGFGWRLGHAVH
jgi:hypothetical protein